MIFYPHLQLIFHLTISYILNFLYPSGVCNFKFIPCLTNFFDFPFIFHLINSCDLINYCHFINPRHFINFYLLTNFYHLINSHDFINSYQLRNSYHPRNTYDSHIYYQSLKKIKKIRRPKPPYLYL